MQTQIDNPSPALRDALIDGRLLSILLTCSLIFNMIDPALMILSDERSMVSLVARMTHRPPLVAVLFIATAALSAPFLLMQVFKPKANCRRRVVRMACLGMCVGGVLWVLLGYLSRNLDYLTTDTWLFVLNGLLDIGLAAILANSINNEQKRAREATP